MGVVRGIISVLRELRRVAAAAKRGIAGVFCNRLSVGDFAIIPLYVGECARYIFRPACRFVRTGQERAELV